MRTTLLRAPLATAAALALAAAVSGCLISGTKVFSYLVGDLRVRGGTVSKATVDLSTNSTYQEHRDEIRLIDRVGFTCHVANNTTAPATVSLWFSTNPDLATVEEVEAQATPLVRNFAVPAAGRDIDYNESLRLLENFDDLQDAVEGGAFTLYSTAPGSFDLTIQRLVLVITFTVGL